MTKEQKEHRQAFMDECAALYMQIWRTLRNLYKDDYEVTSISDDDKFEIEVMPTKRDYIPNCILEEIFALRHKYEVYGLNTYLIDVKPFLIETSYGHMVRTYAPHFKLTIYERNNEQ